MKRSVALALVLLLLWLPLGASRLHADAPPDLSLSLDHAGSFYVASTSATLRLAVSNAPGAGPTTGIITLTVDLHAGLYYVSLTGGSLSGGWSCQAIADDVTCTHGGPLAPGATLPPLVVRVGIDPPALGQITNLASVSTPGEAATANNAASASLAVTADPPPPDLSPTMAPSGSFSYGSVDARFTVTVANGPVAGPTTATAVATVVLPPGLTFRMTDPLTVDWVCLPNGQTITCRDVASLAAGQSSTLSFWVNVVAVAGPVAAVVSVATAGETNLANNSASAPVTVTPGLQTHALTVSRAGTGLGGVVSSPAGIDCGADCAEAYGAGTAVSLAAVPAPGSIFAGWAGACSGVGSCQVIMGQPWSVTAIFDALPASTHLLTVTRAGSGTGAVVSGPAGIDCGEDCTEAYPPGTVVALTAVPGSGSAFAGWAGACTGSGACQVTMSAAASVTATFSPAPPTSFTLSVGKAGPGTGTVLSSPSGIDCGPICVATFGAGSQVTLAALPAPGADGSGSIFAGWGGACAGTGECLVTLDAAKTVTATFTRPNVGVQVGRPPGVPASGAPLLEATLTARAGCGPIERVEFGEAGRPFANAVVSIASAAGAPANQTAGFTYQPPPGVTAVALTIGRVVPSGGATVSPIVLVDGCGAWRTFVGGGPDAFR